MLIGSTQKMGTGTNVQKRLSALHHLDAPWKPAEVEQREGRILRQGNQNEEVAVYRYVTEGSFDAYMWQALETKARFISQIMTGDSTVRRAEDIGSQELSYAEVKAIASGNPAVLTLAEADAELQRLTVLKKNHADEQYLARRNVRDLPITFDRLTKKLSELNADMTTATANAAGPVTIGNRLCHRQEVQEILGATLDALPEHVNALRRFQLGTYRGLKFGIVLHPQFTPEVYLEGVTTRQSMLAKEHHGPRAMLNSLERLANGYNSQCETTQQDLTIAEGQLRDYQARIGTPFLHNSYLSELTTLRDQLKVSLSGTTSEAGTKAEPTSSELAEQIKSLKAAHTIEATPERTGKRRSSAEEPITARIRRKAEVIAVADSPIESQVPELTIDSSSPSDSTAPMALRSLTRSEAPSRGTRPTVPNGTQPGMRR